MTRRYCLLLLVLAVALAGSACAPPGPEPTPTPAPAPSGLTEYAVTAIPLAGFLAKPSAEVSGMAWYGDTLILLPQYPPGAVYALPKADVLAYLDGDGSGPLEPIRVPFVAPGLAGRIAGFEGYEAIAFAGDRAFLTIEASGGGMMGYLVAGQIAPDLSALTLDTGTLVEIPPQSRSSNKSDETLLVAGDRLLTIYEVNGAAMNTSPVAHVFDLSLSAGGTIPLPHVEYRLTDATALDDQERFWAMNYFYPGDTDLVPGSDPLTERYGEGPTHARYDPVERLLEFQVAESGIQLVDRPPIQLELLPDEARNWEGLVRLDERGFLLITDEYPETILGFVAFPGSDI